MDICAVSRCWDCMSRSRMPCAPTIRYMAKVADEGVLHYGIMNYPVLPSALQPIRRNPVLAIPIKGSWVPCVLTCVSTFLLILSGNPPCPSASSIFCEMELLRSVYERKWPFKPIAVEINLPGYKCQGPVSYDPRTHQPKQICEDDVGRHLAMPAVTVSAAVACQMVAEQVWLSTNTIPLWPTPCNCACWYIHDQCINQEWQTKTDSCPQVVFQSARPHLYWQDAIIFIPSSFWRWVLRY